MTNFEQICNIFGILAYLQSLVHTYKPNKHFKRLTIKPDIKNKVAYTYATNKWVSCESQLVIWKIKSNAHRGHETHLRFLLMRHLTQLPTSCGLSRFRKQTLEQRHICTFSFFFFLLLGSLSVCARKVHYTNSMCPLVCGCLLFLCFKKLSNIQENQTIFFETLKENQLCLHYSRSFTFVSL